MDDSPIQLNDLPDEILMIICKNLSESDVLYSLLGVNKRLNKIVRDSFFTSDLHLIKLVPKNLFALTIFSKYSIYSLHDKMIDRFCSQILPEIRYKIKWLHLETCSFERILLATDYPNLYGLSLFNIEVENEDYLFSDENLLPDTLKNQISSLTIDTIPKKRRAFPQKTHSNLFRRIFTMFTNLRSLEFGPYSPDSETLVLHIRPPHNISSTLLRLHVFLDCFADLEYLLNECFNQLRILHTDMFMIGSMSSSIHTEKLPNLRVFSLSCKISTSCYHQLIVPLLHRMPNLENLDLSLSIILENTIVDGYNLKRNIIDYMLQLKKFTFNIRSNIENSQEIDLPSKKNFEQTFTDFKDYSIICYVDYFPKKKEGQCHVYSYPYKLEYYDNITNKFPGGLFKCVREVSLFDERPFEHEFFLQISRSFPLMESLTINNGKRQKNKRLTRANNESIIQYPRLIKLDFIRAHEDYYKQFLYDTKAYLSNNIQFIMDYRIANKVTHNFRRNITRNNCAKTNVVNFLLDYKYPEHLRKPEHLKNYFPCAKIVHHR